MSDRLIELGLLSKEKPAGLIDRLLEILSDAAVEGDTLKTSEFRSQLAIYRRRLAAAADSQSGEFAKHSADCLRVCENFFDRSQKYLLERESEFAQVIGFLREAIGRLSGEATAFQVKLISTSERMDRLVDIQDIRELKKQISAEVSELKRVVTEKQKSDEASYARLSKRVELLQHSLDESRQEASSDSLTGVANRRSFDQALQRMAASHKESGKPFVLAILDLDNFKRINDTHGHQIGDRVLICAAQWFRKYVRSNDLLARFGGEEFAVLLPEVTADQANKKFSEMLAAIAGSNYEYEVGGKFLNVSFTASCGVAEFQPDENIEGFVRRADEALYEAKHTGKNRVVVSCPPRKGKGLWQTLQPLVSFRSN